MGRPVYGIGLCVLLIIAAIVPRTASAQSLDHYTLIMGWLPGQCLVDPDLPLCADLTLKDDAGRNLSLIGLRPDARSNSVALLNCDPMNKAFTTPSFAGDPTIPEACHQPAMRLSGDLAKSLADIMPTAALCAERTFWAKYGSCSMLSQEHYFQRAVDRAAELQHSLLNFAVAGAIGSRVRHQVLVDAFTQQFGDDSAPSLEILCGRSKRRNVPVLTEIRVKLKQLGTMQPLTEKSLWAEAGSAFRQRCPDSFLVAEAGQPVPDPVAKPALPGAVTIPQMPTIPAPQAPTVEAPTIQAPTIAPPADPTKPQPMQVEPIETIPATP